MATEIVERARTNVAADFQFALKPPAPHEAVVIVEDDSAPWIGESGDALTVDMRTKRFRWDSAYAVRMDGVECIRIVAVGREGLRFRNGDTWEPFTGEILGIVTQRSRLVKP